MGETIEQLLTLDPAQQTVDANLDLLLALDKLMSRASARMERALAALADARDEKDFLREEVRCLLRWSDGFTRSRMVQAAKLVNDLPDALERHETGDLNCAQARSIADSCIPLGRSECAEVSERVLLRAGTQTVTEFKNSVTRAVHRVDPRTAHARHEDEKRRRDVSLRMLPDGMAAIWSVHTAVDAEAIMIRVNAAVAKQVSGEARLLGERRADAMVNLILGVECPQQQTQHGRRPTVNIVVPLAVAMGAEELPGELIGYGPIPASLCRDAMADHTARFVRWVVSPLGELVDCSSTYEPNRSLTDFVIARDRTCRMPGCNRKACTCELDHRDDFDGWNTVEANMQALCCRHHHLKTEWPWQVDKAWDGTTVWTSPTGRVYEKPPDHVPGYDDTWRDHWPNEDQRDDPRDVPP